MSKEQPQTVAARLPGGPRAPAGDRLDALLAEREALCAQLSARQVEFATLVREQAGQIAGLRHALSDANASITERYGEIARLSRRVLELEEAVDAGTRKLARAEAALRKHERTAVLVEHERAVRDAERAALSAPPARQHGLAPQLRAMLARARSTLAGKRREHGPETGTSSEIVAYQKKLLGDSGVFDATWYVSRYPDVSASGLDPAEHYLRRGAVAGYDPGPSFDTVAYLTRYPDVRVSGLNPLVHYLEHGRDEQRDPGPARDEAARHDPGTPCS